jgi:23S rRNA (guanosine2251-2'-O)-methyltransferase
MWEHKSKDKKEQQDFIFGIHPILEALEAEKSIDKVLIQTSARGGNTAHLIGQLKQKGIPMAVVPVEKLNRITRNNHQGIIAYISPIEFADIETLLPDLLEKETAPLLLILDGITDVRNLGAIVRTAECAGVQAIIIPGQNMARIGNDAVKTSAGAIFKVPICRSKSLEQTAEYLQQNGLQVIAATEKASDSIYECNLSEPTAIVLGSEEKGISKTLLRIANQLAAIPIQGTISSLNVSVSAGVMLYEAVRQRK